MPHRSDNEFPGRTQEQVEAQREYQRRYMKERRDRFRSEGRCPECGKPPAPRRILCKGCLKSHRKFNRRSYERTGK